MRLFRRLRRRRALKNAPTADWRAGLREVRLLRTLDPERRQRVERDARVFAAESRWEGCGGLVVSDRMKAIVASLACLLVVDTRATLFEDVSSVLLYPTAYFAGPQRTATGVVSEGPIRLGEAHSNGPVVLSWADVERHSRFATGRNVTLHEFAHRLDMLNGIVDGTPPLPEALPGERWHDIMTDEFGILRRSLAWGVPTALDPYAATNPAEFFAVATESYFERPAQLASLRPTLFELLRDYYGVDTSDQPTLA